MKIWERGWKPSERDVLDLEREWKSVPVANVQFIANAVGKVKCKVLVAQSPDKGLFSGVKGKTVNSKHKIAVFVLVVIIFGIWWMSTWGQSGGPSDINSKHSDRRSV